MRGGFLGGRREGRFIESKKQEIWDRVLRVENGMFNGRRLENESCDLGSARKKRKY